MAPPRYIYESTLSRRDSWWGRKRRHPRLVATRMLLVTLGGLAGVLALALVFRLAI